MSAIDQLFTRLRAAGEKALMPFVTAGDPDLDFTSAVVAELVSRGAHLCEIGVPYSDPIADGPVIQASYTRALNHKIKLAQIFEMLARTSPQVSAPLVTMVSYAIIYRHGLQRYVEEAQAAGVAGAIVPDLLVEESAELAAVCRKADFSLVQLVTPTTPRERAMRIAEQSTGFLYYVSVTGITGERTALPQSLVDNVAWLREQTDTPICIGFGINQPEHVRRLAPVADGLIVGSAVVRRVAEADHRPREQVLAELGDYVSSLLAAFK
ncbi:MAG TPA: tryptophan synthase subunit alpha [Pirellulales bacterium]|nr:tryptophan synthase subunit alpha [Pirellulales bacterium]